MSRQMRRNIAYWFMLVLGIAIMILQAKKYYDGSLELKYEEIIVTGIAIIMILNPLSFLDLIRTIINSKYGKNTNE